MKEIIIVLKLNADFDDETRIKVGKKLSEEFGRKVVLLPNFIDSKIDVIK